MSGCQHRLLGDIELVRCDLHSTEKAAVWTWRAEPPEEPGLCPCEEGDRYIVADEHAPPNWLVGADVVLAEPRATVRAAFRVDPPPGQAILAIPILGCGTVFRSKTAISSADKEKCGVCVYPLQVMSGVREPRQERVARPPRGVRRFRRRDSEPA